MAALRKKLSTRMWNTRCLIFGSLLLPFRIAAFSGVIGGFGGNVGGFDNVRFEMQFSLAEGISVTRADIEALLCRTQDYLGEVVYNEFVGQELEVKATDIKWEGLQEAENAVDVTFTAALTGRNGTIVAEMPSAENFREAFDGLDMNDYLDKAVKVSQCPTGFSQATKVEYTTKLTPDIKGTIEEPLCETTCAPSLAPGTPTIAPTKYPTSAPKTAPPKETFVTEEHDETYLRPDHTRSPSGAAAPPVSAVNPDNMPPAHSGDGGKR